MTFTHENDEISTSKDEERDDITEVDVTDKDVDRIMCCSVVNSYTLEILRGADPALIEKQLKQGQRNPQRLRSYRGIIEEKLRVYNGNIGSPQVTPDRREQYKKKISALELLRDKIDIALRDSEV